MSTIPAFKYGRFTHPADAYRKAEDGGDEYTMDDVVNTVLGNAAWRVKYAAWLKNVGVAADDTAQAGS